jgi:capsular polysaccharide export protein
VDELFAAGYMHYTRYLNPETRQLGSIADVTVWLDRQREMAGVTRAHDLRRFSALACLELKADAVLHARWSRTHAPLPR